MWTHCTQLDKANELDPYAFVINNIKPEQVHKCADNDNPANHWRAEKIEAVLFLWHQVAWDPGSIAIVGGFRAWNPLRFMTALK